MNSAPIAPSPNMNPSSVLPTSPKILSTEKVMVDFDGFKAVQDLNFTMRAGELRFLIGPNGAGKTTLLDVICGRIKPTAGKVLFNTDKGEVDLARYQEHQIARLGVGRKFQTPTVFLSLTVLENLELVMHGPRGVLAALKARVSAEQQEKMMTCLRTIGLETKGNLNAGILSHGEKQWLEIGMLLMQEPTLILLDEPAAGMTDHETEKMGVLLKSLSHRQNILVVEHDMEFVRQFADVVTVMHEGRILCEGTMDEVQSNAKVAEVYLERRPAKSSEPVTEIVEASQVEIPPRRGLFGLRSRSHVKH